MENNFNINEIEDEEREKSVKENYKHIIDGIIQLVSFIAYGMCIVVSVNLGVMLGILSYNNLFFKNPIVVSIIFLLIVLVAQFTFVFKCTKKLREKTENWKFYY